MFNMIVSVPGHCLFFIFLFVSVVKAHTIALDYLTEMYIPTKDGLVELKDTVAGTLGRILSENLYLTHTQCEILVKKVLNKHFSVEFISKEERLVQVVCSFDKTSI